MTIRSHKEAFFARLREDGILAACTYEGVVAPDASGQRPNRYLSVFVPSPGNEATRFTGLRTRETYTFTTHSVGTTPDQAQLVADRTATQLLDFTLTVPGRSCSRIMHPPGRATDIEPNVTPPLFYLVDQWDFWSDPA